MSIRQDDGIPITLASIEQFQTKADIRNFLLSTWIAESPQSKYRYFVETLSNGSKIYLERPGRLNKGCDFVIYIENLIQYKNGKDRPPNYAFLMADLSDKKQKLTPPQWQAVLLAFREIHNAGTYNQAIKHTKGIPQHGLPYETVLKLSRWFFIEQDITYWAGLGRDKLFDGIRQL